MAYHPPTNILEVLQKIEYEEALPAGDPRYVDTEAARGSERTFSRLARKFGWDPVSNIFFAPIEKHVLFFGHIGSGKTTELRRYAKQLNDSNRFFAVEVDVLTKLDRNNLQYTEVLMGAEGFENPRPTPLHGRDRKMQPVCHFRHRGTDGKQLKDLHQNR